MYVARVEYKERREPNRCPESQSCIEPATRAASEFSHSRDGVAIFCAKRNILYGKSQNRKMEIVRRFSQGTRSEIRCLETCAHPELIDAGPVVAPLVSGTASYGSLSEAKRSRAAGHETPGLCTGFEIRRAVTCANPELIDLGSVVAPLVSGTDSYGSVSEAKRSRAAESAGFLAEHVPVPAHHRIRNQACGNLRESGTN